MVDNWGLRNSLFGVPGCKTLSVSCHQGQGGGGLHRSKVIGSTEMNLGVLGMNRKVIVQLDGSVRGH